MQYDQPTPEAYLAALDTDWRKDTLLELRALIQSAAPEAGEFMQYKMLAYGTPDNTMCQLNAQKAYVSLYVGNTNKIDPSGQWLEGLSLGKGCIRFSKTTQVSDTRIAEFINEAAQMWRDGKDMGC